MLIWSLLYVYFNVFPSGEKPGGWEQKAGHEAEDPQGQGGLRRENRRDRQAAGERDGAADRELDPRPRKAAGGSDQEPGGGGGHQEEVSRRSWFDWIFLLNTKPPSSLNMSIGVCL